MKRYPVSTFRAPFCSLLVAACFATAFEPHAFSREAAGCKPPVSIAIEPPPVEIRLRPGDPVQQGPVVQLAILLDTSSSMDGLIAQAKSQIWTIVNTLAGLKRDGITPSLEVALFEYGNNGIHAGEQFVRQVLPLTRDLDEVSSRLFALSTNGGDEYCGAAISKAATGLQWSQRKEDFRVIVIAGNEPFTQGQTDFKLSIPAATNAGIVVNTIFCGDAKEGVLTGWKDGANLGGGHYSSIDTNAAAVHIDSPHDAEINTKGAKLNETYLGYGALASEGAAKQMSEDQNAAAAAPGASVQRSMAKAKSVYSNSRWDLLDNLKEKKLAIEDVKESELPENMKKMSVPQRKEYIRALASSREQLQKEIGVLQRQREQFVAAKRAEMEAAGAKPAKTLEDAMISSLKAQAKAKGYDS